MQQRLYRPTSADADEAARKWPDVLELRTNLSGGDEAVLHEAVYKRGHQPRRLRHRGRAWCQLQPHGRHPLNHGALVRQPADQRHYRQAAHLSLLERAGPPELDLRGQRGEERAVGPPHLLGTHPHRHVVCSVIGVAACHRRQQRSRLILLLAVAD